MEEGYKKQILFHAEQHLSVGGQPPKLRGDERFQPIRRRTQPVHRGRYSVATVVGNIRRVVERTQPIQVRPKSCRARFHCFQQLAELFRAIARLLMIDTESAFALRRLHKRRYVLFRA